MTYITSLADLLVTALTATEICWPHSTILWLLMLQVILSQGVGQGCIRPRHTPEMISKIFHMSPLVTVQKIDQRTRWSAVDK